MRFFLNDRELTTDAPGGTPVVDFVREVAGLTGTKHACREGDCGSCLVLLGEADGGVPRYRAVTSCLLPLAEVEGSHLVTIEGLGHGRLTLVQRAIVDHAASQCGFCTPGVVIALTGYLLQAPRFDLDEALIAVAGNLCRCTGYASIRRAVSDVVERLAASIDPDQDRIVALIQHGVVPPYFDSIRDRLGAITREPQRKVRVSTKPLVAGGTDLYVQRPHELRDADPHLLRRTLPSRIWAEGGSMYLSATTTAEELRRSTVIAGVAEGISGFMNLVCSQPVRERATVGGNIVNASPIGDMTIMLLALDAELGISGENGRRVVPLHAFFKGYKQVDLADGELVEWVRFSEQRRTALFNFEKVCRRRYLDIASVNTAACIDIDGDRITRARLSAGGVAPIPLRLVMTEAALVGRPVSAATARGAAAVAETEISPISDVRGSAAYKRTLLRQLILAHFQALFAIERGLVAETGP